MAATGPEIASAYVSLTVKAPDIYKDINKQLGGASWDKSGSQIGSKLAAGMKKTLKVGAAGAAAVLGTALVKGFGRLKAIETAEAKMGAIGFTSKEVAGAMDNALASVKGTAFGLGEAASTASQLMAANIKPGEQLEGILKTVANNAALAGTNFDEMGSIFSKAATQANGVQNDVIGQLADKGIPIYKALGDQMGVTAGEVFKLASEGKVDFDTFAKAAEAAAGTAAEAMGGTTTGAFDNMMAALGRLGAKILEDIFPLIGPLFQDITKWLDEAMVHVEPVVNAFGDGLKNALEGVKTGWQWMKDNSDWLAPLAVSVGTVVAAVTAWVGVTKTIAAVKAAYAAVQATYIALTYGQVGATYAGATAQKVFNAVMNANPIGIIITAIAALVAGLVYFFTQTETGQAIWAEFTRFLGEAWANISSFFKTVWETVLKPVFDGIGAVVEWLWKNILEPNFNALKLIFAVVGGILAGVWEAVIKPVFDAFGAVAKWLWDTILKVVFLAIKLQVQVLGAIFSWLWTTIIKPVFGFIGNLIRSVWTGFIQPVFTAIWNVLKNTLGPVFTWLYNNVIKPVWDGIKNTIKNVWTNGIKPVIDTLVKVIKSDPKKAFEAARDAIGDAWKGIQDLAKKPVKFVVETVINGLIGTINKIPGVNIPKVKLPKGFARGGILPGMSRMSDGDDQLIMARRGEGMMVSEALRTPADRSAFLAANAAGRSGVGFASMLQGFARGGLVNPLPKGSYNVSQPYHGNHNGIDLAAASGTKVYAAADGVVGLAGSVPMGGNEVYIQHSNGLGTRYSHLSRFGTRPGTQVKAGNVIGYVGSTGMSTGPHLHYMVHNPGGGAGNYGAHVNPAPYMGISGKDLGEAGGAQSLLDGLVDWAASKIKGAFPDGGMWVDVAAGLAKDAASKMAKAFNPFAAADGHTATLYDSGGWLDPGTHLVQNKSGRPEPILTAGQWDALLEGRSGSSSGPVRVFIGDREFEGWMDERADEAVDRGIEQAERERRRYASV